MSEWTIETLKEYFTEIVARIEKQNYDKWQESNNALTLAFNARETAMQAAFTAQRQAVTEALASAKEAVNKAEDANEKRFTALNELRDMANDQQLRYMPRAEVELLINNLGDRIDELAKKVEANSTVLSQSSGRLSGATQVWGIFVGAIGVLSAIVAVIIHFIK